MSHLVLSLQPACLDFLGGERYTIPIQGGESLHKGEAFPRYVIYTLSPCHTLITRADINPKGLVPAIEYQGKALYESLILCEFLEDAYPDHKPHLLPTDPFERARARLWIDHTSKAIIPAWYRLVQAQTKEHRDAARQELYDAQRKLAQQVKGPYFAGEEFGLVDVAIAPWVSREYILTEHREYDRAQVGDGWSKYAEHLATRESINKTTSVSVLCSKTGLAYAVDVLG